VAAARARRRLLQLRPPALLGVAGHRLALHRLLPAASPTYYCSLDSRRCSRLLHCQPSRQHGGVIFWFDIQPVELVFECLQRGPHRLEELRCPLVIQHLRCGGGSAWDLTGCCSTTGATYARVSNGHSAW
jgi:hypothetical protein